MKSLKIFMPWIFVIIALWFGFAALATAGVSTVIKDSVFLKFVFWIALVVGNWVVSAIVTYKVVQIKIKMHDEGIFTLSGRINKVKEETEKDIKETKKEFTKKLYGDNGITIYVPRKEHDKEKEVGERRYDKGHRRLCEKVDNVVTSQSDLAGSVSNLIGRFNQYLLDEEKKYGNRKRTD